MGTHEVTADTWGDLGAWDQKIEVMAGQDHYIRIKDRKAASVATALFGVVGLLAEAATATEGQSGPFEVEVLDEIKEGGAVKIGISERGIQSKVERARTSCCGNANDSTES